MKKRILLFPAAWSTKNVFMPQIKYLDKQIDGVIKKFSTALAKTGIKGAITVAENKVVGDFFPGRKPNDKQFVFHIQDTDTETVVGWIWLADCKKGELRVTDLYINEANRRLGYGTAAMIIAQEFAINKKFSIMSLNVFDTNVIAKKMYNCLAYEVVEEGSGRSEMRKRLIFS